MLRNVEPDLQNITHGHSLFSDHTAKDAFAAPGNPYIKVRVFFLGVPRESKIP